MRLTPRQEAFALAYFETGNASEAYRRAYDVGPDANPSTARTEGYRMSKRPQIRARVSELQSFAVASVNYSRERAALELEEVRRLAIKQGKLSPAVSATALKVKLFGLEAPTRFEGTIGNPDGSPLASALDLAKLSDAALREVMAAMQQAVTNATDAKG